MQNQSRPQSPWNALRASLALSLALGLTAACQMFSGDRGVEDLGTARVESLERMQFAGLVKTLVYSQRGGALVVGGCQNSGSNGNNPCTSGLIQVWSLKGTDSQTTLMLPRAVTALAVSPDGSKWVAGDTEGRLVLSTTKMVPRPYHQKAEITALAFSPDGKWVASGSLDALFPLGIMDVVTGGVIKIKVKFEPVSALAFPSDGKVLAVGMSNGRLVVWDFIANTTSIQVTPERGERQAITSTTFSSDGTLLVYGQRDGKVVIWDRSSLQPLVEFKGSSSISGLAFSPDGRYLAIGQDNGKVLLVETKGAHQVWSKRHIVPVSGLAFSPDGGSLAVAAQQHVYLYHVRGVYRAVPAAPRPSREF